MSARPAKTSATASRDGAIARANALLVELRDALAACDQGPLRAIVDSDGHCVVIQPAMGRPNVGKGQHVWGVPVQMCRDLYGPFMPPREIVTEMRG